MLASSALAAPLPHLTGVEYTKQHKLTAADEYEYAASSLFSIEISTAPAPLANNADVLVREMDSPTRRRVRFDESRNQLVYYSQDDPIESPPPTPTLPTARHPLLASVPEELPDAPAPKVALLPDADFNRTATAAPPSEAGVAGPYELIYRAMDEGPSGAVDSSHTQISSLVHLAFLVRGFLFILRTHRRTSALSRDTLGSLLAAISLCVVLVPLSALLDFAVALRWTAGFRYLHIEQPRS